MYFSKYALYIVHAGQPAGRDVKKGRSSAAKWHEALFVIITQKKMKANFFSKKRHAGMKNQDEKVRRKNQNRTGKGIGTGISGGD